MIIPGPLTAKFRVPQDFIIHGLLAFLWLAAASAWAAGAGTLKNGCDPNLWLDQVCNDKYTNVTCKFESGDFSGSFGKLNISLVSELGVAGRGGRAVDGVGVGRR